MTTLKELEILMESGIALCRIDPGTKRPIDASWNTRPIVDVSLFESQGAIDYQFGMITGPLSGGIVCVDIDLPPEDMHLVDEVLPPTRMMDGRIGKERTHRYYKVIDTEWEDSVLPGTSTQTRKAMDAGKLPRFCGSRNFTGTPDTAGSRRGIELKGAGTQIVIPPSLAKDGSRRFWHGGTRGDPAEISYRELLCAIEKLARTIGWKDNGKRSGAAIGSGVRVASLRDGPGSDVYDGLSPLELCRKALGHLGPAVEGNGGHGKTWEACCIGGDYALSPEESWPLLQEWNRACSPPWDEDVLRRKLEEACTNRKREFGCGLGADHHSDMSDLENGRRYAREHGSRIRYCYPHRSWWYFDGRRWVIDKSGQVESLAKKTADRIRAETFQIHDEDRRKRAMRGMHRACSANGLIAMLKMAQSDLAIDPNAFDAHPYVLNALNGTVDLRTGVIRPHEASDFITKLASADYLPEARSAHLDRVLNHLCSDDAATRECLERSLGMAATGDTSAKCLMILGGPADCGKGTLFSAVHAALGDYAQVATLDIFIGKDDCGRASPEILRLRAVRFAYCNETAEGSHLNASKLKRLVGGDENIVARGLYRDHEEFRMTALLALATNAPPSADDLDEALWRRILYFAPTESIPKENRDPGLKAALQYKKEDKEATLSMIVRAAVRWYQEGGGWGALRVSPAMDTALDRYRADQNPLADFLTEKCDIGPGKKARRSDIREAYHGWCTGNGLREMDEREFTRRVRCHRGVEEIKIRGDRGWSGISLRSSAVTPNKQLGEGASPKEGEGGT
jgi:P4 family phage/plasmid primase-like protien